MKLALKTRILNYLRKQDSWINGGEVERLTMSVGYKASSGSRRARELFEEGLLERKEEKGVVWYKYKKQETLVRRTEIVESPSGRFYLGKKISRMTNSKRIKALECKMEQIKDSAERQIEKARRELAVYYQGQSHQVDELQSKMAHLEKYFNIEYSRTEQYIKKQK